MSPSLNTNIIDAGDVLIIGSGLAGLFTSLKLAHRAVTIMTADLPDISSASAWAQSGIAVSLETNDNPTKHSEDTIAAGAGLVDPHISHILAHEAHARINDLLHLGVQFDRYDTGLLRLGREAAHQHNRIIGITGDGTGKAIMDTLWKQCNNTPSIRKLVGFCAIELAIENGCVVGVFARPTYKQNQMSPLLIKARAVILACGGIGHLYETTTNPPLSNGDGIAMAARAGAQISDAEFVQFHPTAFYGLGDPAPLATEALRGEGARLINANGKYFMKQYHKDADLAPRDVVASAVFNEIRKTKYVGLELTKNITDNLESRFPNIASICAKHNIYPEKTPLPVAPAAHYHMGGIRTDEKGLTTIPNLWAVGECASTGAHGANRLASNSLLEGLVFGARIATQIDHLIPIQTIKQPDPPQTHFNVNPEITAPAINKLRQIMTKHVGIIRDESGLLYALEQIQKLEKIAAGYAPLSNMTLTAFMITIAALKRQESRGSHIRTDYPKQNLQPQRSFITLTQAVHYAHEIRERHKQNNLKSNII